MKILYFSDIHIEMLANITMLAGPGDWRKEAPYPLSLGPDLRPFLEEKIDVCVLAGDIGSFVMHEADPIKYADQLAHYLGCEVMFVPGNHEYYGCKDFFMLRTNTVNTRMDRVHILDNGSTEINGVRFIGSTLWTDYRLLGMGMEADCMKTASRYMADHCGAIRKRGANGGLKNFTVEDARRLCEVSQDFMRLILESSPPTPTIIVTHHVPLVYNDTINPKFPVNETTSGFMSHLPDLVDLASKNGTKAWIFGHHHWSLQSEAFGVKLLSSQRGYIHMQENANWDGPQILEI